MVGEIMTKHTYEVFESEEGGIPRNNIEPFYSIQISEIDDFLKWRDMDKPIEAGDTVVDSRLSDSRKYVVLATCGQKAWVCPGSPENVDNKPTYVFRISDLRLANAS